ncbi:hypothetical protein DSECCO2_544600 [anaerobic digester metagenome]
MALVDHHQEVLREVVQQAVGLFAGLAPVEVAGVVLDPLAGSGLADHIDVVERPLAEAVRLDHAEAREPFLEFLLYRDDRLLFHLIGGDEVPRRVDEEVVHRLEPLSRYLVDLADPVDLVPEEFDPDDVVEVAGDDIDGVALHAEPARHEFELVSLELDVDESPDDVVPPHPVADLHLEPHPLEVRGVPETVDAGDRSDDDGVGAGEDRGGGRKPHLLDLGVDLGVFLDVKVALRDVGLGLVVVVVGDEVLHPVIGEERLELVVELGGKRLVVGYDECGLLDLLDDVCYRERLPRARDPEEGLVPLVAGKAVAEFPDRVGLRSGRLEVSLEVKFRHGATVFFLRVL